MTLDRFLRASDVAVIAFGTRHFAGRIDAFVRYGKGRHPAGLNDGDCRTYARGEISGVPLIAKGSASR